MLCAGKSMVMTLEPRDAQQGALKTTRSWSSTSSDQFARRYCSHQHSAPPQRKLAAYFLDIRKLHEVLVPTNQESSQSEIPTSGYGWNIEGRALWNFLDSTQRQNETGITPTSELGLRWMTTRWKGNFINFSIDLYFGIYSVEYTGESPRRRDRSNAMRTRYRK